MAVLSGRPASPKAEVGHSDAGACVWSRLVPDEEAGSLLDERVQSPRRARIALPLRTAPPTLAVGAALSAGVLAVTGWSLVKLMRTGAASPADPVAVQALDEKEALPWYMGMELSTSPPPEEMGDNMEGHWGFSASGWGPGVLNVGQSVTTNVDERIENMMPHEVGEMREQPSPVAPGSPPASRRPAAPNSPPPPAREPAPAPRPAQQPPPQPASKPPTPEELQASKPCGSADGELLKQRGREQFQSDMNGCSLPCWGNSGCVSDCMADHGYTAGCSQCFGELSSCTRSNCMWQCMGGNSPGCSSCADQNCKPVFEKCSGLSLEWRRLSATRGLQ